MRASRASARSNRDSAVPASIAARSTAPPASRSCLALGPPRLRSEAWRYLSSRAAFIFAQVQQGGRSSLHCVYATHKVSDGHISIITIYSHRIRPKTKQIVVRWASFRPPTSNCPGNAYFSQTGFSAERFSGCWLQAHLYRHGGIRLKQAKRYVTLYCPLYWMQRRIALLKPIHTCSRTRPHQRNRRFEFL